MHPFPSSVDVAHFAQARRISTDPADQAPVPHPRLGFFGVIDERLDIALVDGVAAARPDWHVVMLGPVVKIEPASLPQRPNIHYLGPKHYNELPQYVAGWDVALLPFARNEATRFISPTKTPEYMAAGKPVVSTSIQDVVRPYGQQGLVRIADEVPAFVRACIAAMAEDEAKRVTQADAFLRQTSWDGTWRRIRLLLEDVLRGDVAEHERGLAGGAAAV
jgi:UDP-galactopyranose mutase